jgi:hypothetical protein
MYAGVISPFSLPTTHTRNLHLRPRPPPKKHHLYVPCWPPPPIEPLILIRMLWRGCLSHRHHSPYDPTQLFRLQPRSASRNRSPSALFVRGSTSTAFDDCGVVSLVFKPPRGPPFASHGPYMWSSDRKNDDSADPPSDLLNSFVWDKKIFGMSHAADMMGKGQLGKPPLPLLPFKTTPVSASLILFGRFYTSN